MMVDGVSVGSSKKAAHSMVFSWGEAVEANPPRFFALSFPRKCNVAELMTDY